LVAVWRPARMPMSGVGVVLVRPAAPGPFRGLGGGFVLMGGISAGQAAGATFGLWWVSDHRCGVCVLAWCVGAGDGGGLVHCRVLEQQAPP